MRMARGRLGTVGMQKLAAAAAAIGLSAAIGVTGCALFQSEQVSKGRHLYDHYCMHCHGEHGRQNEGFNWTHMPDPKPKDLSNKSEMSTFKDEEIFNTVSRNMKDTTPEIGDKIGDDEFAVPTMPTFKYTLSEEEIWSVVAYVRTLHGMKLTFNIEKRKHELEDAQKGAQAKYDQVKQTLEAAKKKAQEAADAKGEDVEVDESLYAKEEAAFDAAEKEQKEAQLALESFSSRPKMAAIARPDLTMAPDASAKLADLGKRLYSNKYGCNACHRVGEEGGIVGPALDRAGFRLNPPWVFRWVKYPQFMKPETRMPNLGLSDPDAKAVTMYLATLKAPKPDQPIQKAGN